MGNAQKSLTMRKKLRWIYLVVIALVLGISAFWLISKFNSYIIISILVGIGLGSIVTSLVPYFISMELLKQYETKPERKAFKIFGIILYIFCFPIKIWVIFAIIYEILYGNNHWNFG
ncbi:hypothetical protein Fluta_3603 [Fluviicola taffensis DSM 16823]|uniref:Uncharacterized protein n=1 Tax=Fluviicola taffensis (strain DSM 16823 / NCIMB 13979 / RW262) TaxID=755732 RepID=F2IE08_FLUTR|nr:hypothetical protein Fluta_3603 [Fluviicola taffensis DSM 16823]